MMTLIAGAAIAFALWRIGDVLRRQHREATIQHLLATFAPAAAAVQPDPKQLLAWYPLAQTSRKLFPDAFKAAGPRRRRSISVYERADSGRARAMQLRLARVGTRA